ncbi:MAG: hypothetical protein OEY43_08755 [Gammaproteobacteria bacterium]|nr:hypothetical protein [Gammaproteobacteria bacterium]
MTNPTKMSKQQAIDELRKEAQALEDKPCSIKDYASNIHKARIRRELADQFERELQEGYPGVN